MFTQNNEEELILNFFNGRDVSELTVLDIGANDGKTLSNSYRVILDGWNAHLIEPSPKAFKRMYELHKNNDKVILHNYAITDEDKDFQLYESKSLLGEEDVALVSSLKFNETIRWRNENIEYDVINVKGITYKTFEDIVGDVEFNLISIDIEGFDYEVLSQIDLVKSGCEMLIVEFNGKEENKFTDYVSKFDMVLISKNPENLIYTKIK